MDKIKIAITGRVASVVALPEVVADNAEYEVDFALDPREGWDMALPITALFVRRDGSYTPRIMDAGKTSCTMPPQTGTNIVYVGLTQDDMRTTTPATIKVRRSIRTVANDPLPEPTEDVYAQILAAYAGIKILSGKGAPTSATQGKVNQLYRDEDTQKLYICTATDGGYTWAAVSGSGGTVDVDATLTKAGQAADAKAAGDAIGKKLDAPQTAAVGEVLTVEEVDKDSKPIKWKAAKVSGTFVCTFNDGEDGWITCDKTVEEIITANNDGKDVIGHYYGEIYRLSTPFETGGGYGNPIFSNLGVGVLSIIMYDVGHFGINRIRLSDIAPEDAPDTYEVPVYVPTKDGMQWQYCRPLLATDYLMDELTDEEKALMQKNLGIDDLSLVKYTEQGLTEDQKQQARKNIGAGTSNFSGSYNDLTNTPVLDTTLEQSGKPADAKAVGDAIGSAIDAVTTILGASKVDKSQGTENAGKILGIGASGIVTPVDKPVYTLPIATPTALGGVMPVAKTTAMTQDVGVSEDGKLYTAPSGGGTDKSLGITSATVGQIAKITAVDSAGKPTGLEPVDMPTVSGDYELVFQETVAEDVRSYSRDTDKDGNPFSLTDVMVIIFTKPFADSANKTGRALGFLPTAIWGEGAVLRISDSIKSGGTDVGCYDVACVKLINGYQICDRYYRSQNTTNVFGTMQERVAAGETGIQFHTDVNKLMEIRCPQGNMTCVKIVGYSNPLVSAGTIVALYKKKGT